jgi:hypothetical protein
MPLMDFNQQATWDTLYAAYVGPAGDQLVHYTRSVAGVHYGAAYTECRKKLPLNPAWKILIVGAGFGWGAEDFKNAGYTVTCTDTSAWIQTNLSSNATLPILNEDILTAAGRTAIGKQDYIFTEDVLPSLSDSEVATFIAACRLVTSHVAHLVTPLVTDGGQHPALNWKTLQQWKTAVTPDFVVDRTTATYL